MVVFSIAIIQGVAALRSDQWCCVHFYHSHHIEKVIKPVTLAALAWLRSIIFHDCGEIMIYFMRMRLTYGCDTEMSTRRLPEGGSKEKTPNTLHRGPLHVLRSRFMNSFATFVVSAHSNGRTR